jgi:hypothetical protein
MVANTFSFITQPFRYAEQADAAVRTNYQLSRQVQIEGRLTNLTDADALAVILHNILKAPRQRFEVTVLGINIMVPSSLDGQTPCALLTNDRFNLQSGLVVLIPDFTINPGTGQTVLRCWG